MTMVDGRIVVEGGKLLTADLQKLICDMNRALPDLFHRRTEWLATHEPVNELLKDKDQPH